MASIEIVEYQPRWVEEFTRIGAALRRELGAWARSIHHIGSTSVPGLAAKDLIDVQVSVAQLEISDEIRSAFDAAGFPIPPDAPNRDHVPSGLDDSPDNWAKAMARQRPGKRRVNVHVRAVGRPNQRYPLLFRDYLRVNTGAAATYGLIKRELAKLHPEDMDAYYDVKDPVCDLIMAAAEQWAHQHHWVSPATDA